MIGTLRGMIGGITLPLMIAVGTGRGLTTSKTYLSKMSLCPRYGIGRVITLTR